MISFDTYFLTHVIITGAVHVVFRPGVLGVLEVSEVGLINGRASPVPLRLVHSLAHLRIYFKL